MSKSNVTRRGFLRTTIGTAAATAAVPYIFTGQNALAAEGDKGKPMAKNDRLRIGQIGCGGQGNGDTGHSLPFGDVLAVCDVDSGRAAGAKARQGKGKADTYGDYRNLLDRKDIDVVIIATPDHWHTKIAIEAMQSGKDVYCEKPLTLTVDEGKMICEAVKKYNKVFQVGTQQRSSGPFATAVAMARAGRLGKIKNITVAIGTAPTSPSLPKVEVPKELDWNMWLGQAPLVDYISAPARGRSTPQSRCHYEFRWWLEYSGGKMTDWGAHHVDIAHWVLGASDTGPVSFEGTATFPVKFEKGFPTQADRYNVATTFNVKTKFADGAELVIVDKDPRFDNGVWVEGEKDHLFVNREKLTGPAVDKLKANPLPSDAIAKLLNGQQHGNHMRNFVQCVKSRQQPISDVNSHHRAISTCHIANICLRLARPLKWDPAAQQFVGDDEANTFLKRPQRAGFEITV